MEHSSSTPSDLCARGNRKTVILEMLKDNKSEDGEAFMCTLSDAVGAAAFIPSVMNISITH